jgi:hypothetical protein
MTLNNVYDTQAAAESLYRIMQGQASGNVPIGHGLGPISTPLGGIEWRPDIFISALHEAAYVPHVLSRTTPRTVTEGPTSVRAPNTPTATAAIVAPGGLDPEDVSKFTATGNRKGDGTVRYKYRVNARNRWGKSVATVEIDPGDDVAAGGAIDVTISPTAGNFTADSFEIYSYAAPADVAALGLFKAYTKIGEVAADGTSDVVFRDLNHKIPRTTVMYLGDTTYTGLRRTMAIARLLPIFNQDLALVGPYTHGLATYALAMKYYAPERLMIIENVPVDVVTTSNRLMV